MQDCREISVVRDALHDVPSTERDNHADLVARNIDFLIEILSAEQISHGRYLPAGCPTALAAATARYREKSGGIFPCSYEDVSPPIDSPECNCGDPLHGSDDPLDAVAAVVLGSSDRDGSKRYFDHEWRAVVADVRKEHGDWKDIASLSSGQLREILSEVTSRKGVACQRVGRLESALEYIEAHRYTESITLSNLPAVAYQRLADFLEGCPGLNEQDAWWLVLSALDKPIWPSNPEIDTLLADFGLIEVEDLSNDQPRNTTIENSLTDRQIPKLHRAMAGHALKAGPTYCGSDCEVRKFSLLYRSERQNEVEPEGPTVVDLFSGAGCLSSGFARVGHQIELAIDDDERATDSYRLNHPEIPHDRVLCADIESLLEGDLETTLSASIDIVIGGPPCQSLSQAGYRARLANDDNYSILDDPRTHLYRAYVEMVERLDPSVILMENVEGIINEVGDSKVRVLDQIQDALESRGYVCRAKLLDCSNYGVPQERERVFLLGLKPELAPTGSVVEGIFDTLEARAPDTEYSLLEGLAGLPRLRRGEGGNAVPYRNPGRLGEYINRYDLRGHTQLTLNHLARKHPKAKDRELFDSVMEPGDTGWEVIYEKGRDDLIEYDVGTADNPRFIDKYRMIHWDRPAPTVVAHLAKDANNFIIPDFYVHGRTDPSRADPKRNRGITPREAARLQSFPDDYIFLGPYTSQFRQIGNAVPPILGQQLAEVLSDVLALNGAESGSHAPDMTSTEPATGD